MNPWIEISNAAPEGARGVILKSIYGYEINDVRIMGAEKYLVARTPETMLLGMGGFTPRFGGFFSSLKVLLLCAF